MREKLLLKSDFGSEGGFGRAFIKKRFLEE